MVEDLTDYVEEKLFPGCYRSQMVHNREETDHMLKFVPSSWWVYAHARPEDGLASSRLMYTTANLL